MSNWHQSLAHFSGSWSSHQTPCRCWPLGSCLMSIPVFKCANCTNVLLCYHIKSNPRIFTCEVDWNWRSDLIGSRWFPCKKEKKKMWIKPLQGSHEKKPTHAVKFTRDKQFVNIGSMKKSLCASEIQFFLSLLSPNVFFFFFCIDTTIQFCVRWKIFVWRR